LLATSTFSWKSTKIYLFDRAELTTGVAHRVLIHN